MKYCINIKQSKAKQSKAKHELRILINNSFKTFLIALLSFILLFSISCKPKQNPTPKYSELVGTWTSKEGNLRSFILTIDNDGNINFNCGLSPDTSGYHYNYTGKLADDFDYPYTIELNFPLSSFTDSCKGYNYEPSDYENLAKEKKTGTGTFTFRDASTCEASVDMVGKPSTTWQQIRFNDTGAGYNRKNLFTKQ